MENNTQVDWFVRRFYEHRDQISEEFTHAMDTFFEKFFNDLAMLNGSVPLNRSTSSLNVAINRIIGQTFSESILQATPPSENPAQSSNTKAALTTLIELIPESINYSDSVSVSSQTAATSEAEATFSQLSQKSLPFKKRKFDSASTENDSTENSSNSEKSVCSPKKIKIDSKNSKVDCFNENDKESKDIKFLSEKGPSQRSSGPPWFCHRGSPCLLMFVTEEAFDRHVKTAHK